MIVLDGVEMLEIREAAAYAQRTPETIRRWVWSGRLAARRQGNRLLVARRDLTAPVQPARSALGLAEWEARLSGPAGGSPASAADLVLADRAGRDADDHR